MGLLDRAVQRLKAEEAQTKSDSGSPRSSLAKPKRARPREMAVESADEMHLHPAASPLPGDRWQGAVADRGRVDVDLPRLASLGFAVPGFPQPSGLLDEHRRIKRALLFNAAVEQLDDGPNLPSNLILITSAVAGEGKTFVATNLALILSLEVNRQALLIDADVIRRGTSHLLGLEGFPGLIDYLAGDVDDLAELLVRPEGLENLQILPAGRPHENVNELLSSDRMLELVEELSFADPDRMAVIDSPPLLMTSETGLLTRYVGQIALVVRADSTPRYTVDLALASIPPERFAGLILNDAARLRSADGYTEYYEE